jgi:hypothetical protein
MAGLDTVAARIAAILTVIGLPVAVVGVWRDVVMNHPALAVVLLGVYEILVAMLLFAGKIATDLQERWRPRIVDRVDREVEQRLSRFDESYREFMLGSLRFIDLKGLATVGFYTPELEEVFVDVSLAFREPNPRLSRPPAASGLGGHRCSRQWEDHLVAPHGPTALPRPPGPTAYGTDTAVSA